MLHSRAAKSSRRQPAAWFQCRSILWMPFWKKQNSSPINSLGVFHLGSPTSPPPYKHMSLIRMGILFHQTGEVTGCIRCPRKTEALTMLSLSDLIYFKRILMKKKQREHTPSMNRKLMSPGWDEVVYHVSSFREASMLYDRALVVTVTEDLNRYRWN